MEVDAEKAMDRWRSALRAFDLDAIGERYGALGAEALKSIGLEELKELASAPPPGVDEVVALAQVFRRREDYDRVVVDTAPTGHALRLLELPTFAETFLAKLTRLKDAARAVANLAGGFLGSDSVQVVDDLEFALSKIETLRVGVADVRDTLKDSSKCEFVAVAIPTSLSFLETERLVESLASDSGVRCSSLVVNKVLKSDGFSEAKTRGLVRQQRACLQRLKAAVSDLPVVEVPFVDSAEVVGPDALRYLASTAPQLLFDDTSSKTSSSKLVVCGGKGGVGKSTTAATIAVAAADAGLRTCVVSTDPAHSLGDALGLTGQPLGTRTPVTALPGLDVLEIDADAAAAEASEILKDAVLSKLATDATTEGLASLAEALETPPPGVDELVALLKVLTLLRDPDLDLVVLDTAPTGHTLRMLALPELLDEFADRAIRARDKLKRNPLVKTALSAAGVTLPAPADDADTTNDRLKDLQDRAFALDAVLHDPGRTAFVIVAAPTDLSVAETQRLDHQLRDSQIPRSKLVVNGLVADADLDTFAGHLQKTQQAALANLEALAHTRNLRLTLLPQFDTDVSGRYGLLALAHSLFTAAPAAAASSSR